MPLDSDVALLGTGVAPLVAAKSLITQGKSVLLLNPDRDFFLEDSELPLDPLLPFDDRSPLRASRMSRSTVDPTLIELRPLFPGAVEFWTGTGSSPAGARSFHDPLAPHVRQRTRLWMTAGERATEDWEALEELYVEASDGSLNPQILEGIPAAKRFPGFSGSDGNFRAIAIPRLCDYDVARYRVGLLEFLRERLPSERVVCDALQIEPMPEGIRFHAGGTSSTARIKEGIIAFWTPRMTPWVLAQAKRMEISPVLPEGIRLWEHWSINSRDPVDPGVIGIFADMAVWSEFDGAPPSEPEALSRMSVLRSGSLVPMKFGPGSFLDLSRLEASWASAASFSSLTALCSGLLKWDRFSVRSMKVKALFEWGDESPWFLSGENPRLMIVPGCEGPLTDVVRNARTCCEIGAHS